MTKTCFSGLVMRQALLGVITVSCIPVSSVTAGEGDAFRPFFNASMGYDSNLFRFANDAEAASVGQNPLSPLSGITSIDTVTYQRYGAGVDLDMKKSRQQVRARVAMDKTLFSKFARLLDYSGRDMNVEWNWQAGKHWSGQLAASQKRNLAPYTNTTNNTIDSNLRTDEQQVFQAEYWFHPDWRLRARLAHAKTEYSAQKSRDNARDNATIGLYRLGQAMETMGVELVNTDGTFDGNSKRDYREQGIRFIGVWNYSGKTRLNGRLGYIQRSRDEEVESDYSGIEWRLEARWQPTGKTQFDAAFFRNLRDNDEVDTDYEVVDGVKLTAAWLVGPKTRLITEVSREHIDYQGIVRKEKQTGIGLSAHYEAWAGGDISAGIKHTRRESPDAPRGFDSNTLFISANLKF